MKKILDTFKSKFEDSHIQGKYSEVIGECKNRSDSYSVGYSVKQKTLVISKAFTYAELCHIEQALESFNPDYPINEQMVSELKENVTAARGWLHHIGKCERIEEKEV